MPDKRTVYGTNCSLFQIAPRGPNSFTEYAYATCNGGYVRRISSLHHAMVKHEYTPCNDWDEFDPKNGRVPEGPWAPIEFVPASVPSSVHHLNNHRPAANLRNLVAATQEGVALTLGVCQSTVAKSEAAGSGISVRTLERLANALGFELQLTIKPF